ncbi:hypothetical protein BASA60_000747 [Batrachochytrium salamandrivorans]|nr:hypothetical protein BASA60_000747 [Batrachochytrium salamandrivorans]
MMPSSLAFEKKFKQKPKLFARSPGRESILTIQATRVLPMAIDSDIVIAVAVAADSDPCRFKVDISNIDESTYPDQYIDVLLDQPIFINSAIHEWSNYFKCGCKGALENSNHDGLKSMMVMISGNYTSRLSSSSALVCASVIATLAIQGINKPKDDLVQIAIRSERYAGVHTGGMDQSISIMGQQGNILMIHFYPTLSISPSISISSPEPYTLEDISQELGISTEEARKTFIGELIIYDADGFDLYKRTLHVFSEARRVYMFWDTCAHASKEPGPYASRLGSPDE